MKRFVFWVLMTLGCLAGSGYARSADSKEIYVYKIAGKDIRFIRTERGFVDQACADRKNCVAAGTKPEARLVDYVRAGGVNPGSTYCTVGLKGKVVMGYNVKRGQQSFCLFDDGSMIDNFSLYKSLKKN